jgi:hypothetical protein
MRLSKGKVETLKEYDNGTATARALILHTQDTPVVDTDGSEVKLDKRFLEKVQSRFNKNHTGLMGRFKRYPRLIEEHRDDDINHVVGRIHSNIDLRQYDMDADNDHWGLYCDVLITDEDVIQAIKNGKTGLSVGVFFDSHGSYLYELTTTDDPAQNAMFLSAGKQYEYALDSTKFERRVLKIQNELQELEKKREMRLSREKQKAQEREKKKKVHAVLLNKVAQNKIVRRDADRLAEKLKHRDPDDIEEIFKYVAPLRLNTINRFSSKIVPKPEANDENNGGNNG